MRYEHTPVMIEEVIKYLNPQPGEKIIDCTLGGGGYTWSIADRVGEKGKVLAIDLDELAIKNAKEKIKKTKNKNIILVHANFKDLSKIIKENFKEDSRFDGIVFDLGLSSAQLQDRDRGFSFQLDSPIDMAFGRDDGARRRTTEYLVNHLGGKELEEILRKYGEERFAGRIARAITEARKAGPIKTTGRLKEIIEKSVPSFYKRGKIHFATRTFQALRIATNDELGNLEKALENSLENLRSGARIVVVAYHSLEDRIVKKFFKKESKNCVCPPELPVCRCGHAARLKILTPKVVIPKDSETENNPRSRSAKLRAAEII